MEIQAPHVEQPRDLQVNGIREYSRKKESDMACASERNSKGARKVKAGWVLNKQAESRLASFSFSTDRFIHQCEVHHQGEQSLHDKLPGCQRPKLTLLDLFWTVSDPKSAMRGYFAKNEQSDSMNG